MEKIASAVLLLFVVFGALVEQSFGVSRTPHGRSGRVLRAAWRFANDADLYAITSDTIGIICIRRSIDPVDAAGRPAKTADPRGICAVRRVGGALLPDQLLSSLFAGAHVLAKALEERVLDAGQTGRTADAGGSRLCRC